MSVLHAYARVSSSPTQTSFRYVLNDRFKDPMKVICSFPRCFLSPLPLTKDQSNKRTKRNELMRKIDTFQIALNK